MGTHAILPLADHAEGDYPFGPIPTPNGLAGFSVAIGRCSSQTSDLWPDAGVFMTLDLQFSFDGGETFTDEGKNRWSQGGGIIVQRGVECAESVITWQFKPDQPTHVRGFIRVSGGSARTHATLSVP